MMAWMSFFRPSNIASFARESAGPTGWPEAWASAAPGAIASLPTTAPTSARSRPSRALRGSGTIFFSPCNMRCLFCQNYQISQATTGEPVSVEGLVDIFFDLAGKGVHNINLVSPTPYAPLIARAIKAPRGPASTSHSFTTQAPTRRGRRFDPSRGS